MSLDRVGGLTPTPPMGWNSWDCFGSLVTEDEVKVNADYMAAHLKSFGWRHVVVDIRWYEPTHELSEPLSDGVALDEYGRYLPAMNRFPSAAGGNGFRPLADYVHSKGLRFGIHIMRGLPCLAADRKSPIEGTRYTADLVADRERVCTWNPNFHDNYGVDVARPGGQEYYDSIIRLYASWGVDFIKADDMAWPYQEQEIQAVAEAIARSGREIVLSLSPGEADMSQVAHMHRVANMFRISGDFWDYWARPGYVGLREQFDHCARWAPHMREGHWPDADMLPLGRIGKNDAEGEDRQTYFTPDEQYTLMSLQAIFRSPLMFGGNLAEMDDFTLGLLTNPQVLAVNQYSRNNRPLHSEEDRVAWVADAPAAREKYLALFNRSEDEMWVGVDLADIGVSGRVKLQDLWQRREIGETTGRVEQELRPHASALLRLTAMG